MSDTIKKVDVFYAKSTSFIIPPADGWSTDSPKWEDGSFIWSKTKTTYTDGRVINSSPVCITGATGAPGNQGKPGENAISGYLTNESIVLYADPTGVVSSYSQAKGFFRVTEGNDQALVGITYSLVSATGVTVLINSDGAYAVTA